MSHQSKARRQIIPSASLQTQALHPEDFLELQLRNNLRRIDERTPLLEPLPSNDRAVVVQRMQTLLIASNHEHASLIVGAERRLPAFQRSVTLQRRLPDRSKRGETTRLADRKTLVRRGGLIGITVDCEILVSFFRSYVVDISVFLFCLLS